MQHAVGVDRMSLDVFFVCRCLTPPPPPPSRPTPLLTQRLVGIVVQEVGTRSTPASEMILSSFLAWEREIRKELTEPAWEVSVPASRRCPVVQYMCSRGSAVDSP